MASSPSGQRPMVSDGKRLREVWQPGDGDGDPSPELLEKHRSGKNGHPTWKIYTGGTSHIVKGASEPPKWVYLDDEAAYDILLSKVYSGHERMRFWPFDFISKGQIKTQRCHRGRPAYAADGLTVAAVPKKGGKYYHFYGEAGPPPDAMKQARPVDKTSNKDIASKQIAKNIAAPSSRVTMPEPTDSSVHDGGSVKATPTQNPTVTTTEHHTPAGSPRTSIQQFRASDLASELPRGREVSAFEGEHINRHVDLDVPRAQSTQGVRNVDRIITEPTKQQSAPPVLSVSDTAALQEATADGNVVLPAAGADSLAGNLKRGADTGGQSEHLDGAGAPAPKRQRRSILDHISSSASSGASPESVHLDGQAEGAPRRSRVISNELDTLHRQVVDLQEVLDAQRAQNSRLHTQLADQNGIVAARDQEIASLKSQVTQADKKVEASTTQMATMKARLEASMKETAAFKKRAMEMEEDAITAKKLWSEKNASRSSTDAEASEELKLLRTERDTFREVAMRLYAAKVDQESGLADRHAAVAKVVDGLQREVTRLATLTKNCQAELEPLQMLHKSTGTTLDAQEALMRGKGMEAEWKKFIEEAMSL